jgi:hypothetical protein
LNSLRRKALPISLIASAAIAAGIFISPKWKEIRQKDKNKSRNTAENKARKT